MNVIEPNMNNNSPTLKLSNTQTLKPVLVISASDSSGAAGMQVDIRVANDLGHPPRCALTAVTVQGEKGVLRIHPVPPDNISDSIASALSDAPGIGSVKIGLITGPDAADAVSRSLTSLEGEGIPIVLDPVLRSTPGSALSSPEAKIRLVRALLSQATVLTPNREELKELSVLAGEHRNEEEPRVNALISLGADSVLVTGGDDSPKTCVDILYRPEHPPLLLEHPRIGTRPTRGTGCTLSTALAAYLGRGMELPEAVEAAIKYVTDRIGRAFPVGNQNLLFPGKGKRFEV